MSTESFIQESFNRLNIYLCDVLKNKINGCRLLYEPSEYKPYCYILLSRNSELLPENVWTEIIGPMAPNSVDGYPFSVLIDSYENHLSGHNPEFETYDKNGEKMNFSTFPNGVDVDADNFFDELIIGWENVLVMFGHHYDAANKVWDNSVAIWVCFEDPIRRFFDTSKSERRQMSYKGIPVHYFSANSKLLGNTTHKRRTFEEIETTRKGELLNWTRNKNKTYHPGTGFRANFDNGESAFKGTIGPNVKTFPCSNFGKELPDNYYFVSRHVVIFHGVSCDNEYIYDVVTNKRIGRLVATHKFLDVAIIELYCNHTSAVKINANNDCLEVQDFIFFDQQNICIGDLFSRNIFTSAAETGVTKGNIHSWGIYVHKKCKPQSTKEFFLVGLENNGANRGDSGSAVVAIQENRKASFLGMVTGTITLSVKLRLCVILPILPDLLDFQLYDVLDADADAFVVDSCC